MQTFIAFPASKRLHENTQGFINRMKDSPRKTEAATMEAIMSDFTSEALNTFFVLPSQTLGLSRTMMAIVQGTVSTIRAASSMVIKRTASKLDLAQNQEVARYMDIMRICTKDADGKDVWQVSFPLKSDLLKQVREGLKQLEGNHVEAARHTLSEYLLQLTDESLFWYFEQPMALLHLGPILSRICKAGTETARKASRAVIQRVFTKLDARQMETVGGFLKELLVECEPRFPEQSAN